MVHAAYVEQLEITDSTITDASNDAWDLEFVKGTLRRTGVANAGDDGIDLMGSEVDVFDSTLVGVKQNGVSAGEQTRVKVRHSVISDTKVGVLAKNASNVDLLGTLLFRTIFRPSAAILSPL